MMKKNKTIFLFSGVVLLIMFAISFWAWPQIPAGQLVPIHWNINGEPDRYGSKFIGLFLLPLITAGTVLLFTIIPYIDPRRANIVQSRKAYFVTWGGTMLFLLVIHLAGTLNTLGQAIDIIVITSISVGILLVVIGNYMGKIRSNYMFGIRTPWTIDSELAWNKTHRLGGKLFMFIGLLTILSAVFLGDATPVIVMLGGLITITLILIVYSYLVWKNDPTVKPG